MSADILPFTGYTRHNLDPRQMLKNLSEDEHVALKMVVCIGLTEDGQTVVATSQCHDGDTLMVLERGKDAILEDYRYGPE